MVSWSPNSAIFYSDSHDEIKRKIAMAVTGGKDTLSLQIKEGGNPDMRICSVSSLMAFYVVGETEEYKKICQDCRDGKLLCKGCKSRCIDFMIKYIDEHQKKREEIKNDVLKWIRDNRVFESSK